jgi:holo-[acyl-carrier protein] synthase
VPVIYGVGVDVIELARFQSAIERRPRLIERIFDDVEVAYATGPHYVYRLAARWAAKEAIVKACHGFRGSAWKELVVHGEVNRPPVVELRGPLAEWVTSHHGRVFVSLSHEKTMAAAVAVLEVEDAGHLDGRRDTSR